MPRGGAVRSQQGIFFSPFQLDLAREQVWYEGQLVPLRPKLFAILRYLVEHAGRLVPREELLQAVWPDTVVSDSVLRGCIRALREALEDDAEAPRFIETVARRGYRFLAPLTAASSIQGSRFNVQRAGIGPQAPDAGLSPTPNIQHPIPTLVGREGELRQLRGWFEKARQGQRQMVFVTGEPGIGKTTVVEAVLNLIPNPQSPIPNLWIGRGQCVEHYGAGEAYLPVLEALSRLCREARGERLIAVLRQYAPTWLVQMPSLLPEAELEIVQRKVQGATRERMLREFAEAIEVLTVETLLVLLLEDLHWSDYATIDLLSLLARRREAARLLVHGTYRPADLVMSGHPLKAARQELQTHGHCQELALTFLTDVAVGQYLAARFPAHQLPMGLTHFIYQNTDGNPLFVVNLVDDLVAQGALRVVEGQWRLQKAVAEVERNVPDSLRQLLVQQLERLPPEQQRLLSAASVIGNEFAAATVAASVGGTVEQAEESCETLVRRGQFLQAVDVGVLPDGTVTGHYRFQHALYQTMLYQGTAEIQRLRLHRRIGEIVERQYRERAREIAAELAVHFDRGQDGQRAVTYLHQAAENAFRRYAYHQAVTLLTRALEVLRSWPESRERDQQELVLQTLLGSAFLITKGYAALEAKLAYTRARDLCQRFNETPQLFSVLFALRLFHTVRGGLRTGLEIIEQLTRLARNMPEPEFLVAVQSHKAQLLYFLGDCVTARTLCEEVVAFYEKHEQGAHAFLYGQGPGVVAQGTLAGVLWVLGYPDQGLQASQHAIASTRKSAHGLNLMTALWHEIALRGYRREWSYVRAAAIEQVAFGSSQEFPMWRALGTYGQGLALAGEEQYETGLPQMRQGIAAYQSIGAALGLTGLQTRLAERYVQAHLTAEGQALVADAFTVMERTEERILEAELYRLKGELTLQKFQVSAFKFQGQKSPRSKAQSPRSKIPDPRPLTPNPQTEAEAEACFLKALDIARRQQAKSLELRAVMSLARLWYRQGRTAAAPGRSL